MSHSIIPIYINNEKKELIEFLNSKKDYKIIDEDVTISSQKLPVRLIAVKVPDEVYNKRVRDLKESHRRRGKTPKKETLELQRYVIFITNIPREMIAPEHIGTIYRLRWEIELCFKRWKSIFKIDSLTGKNGNRALCFIYAKLIALLMMNTIEQYAFILASKKGRELSLDKFFKWLTDRDRFQMLLAGKYSVTKFLKLIGDNIRRTLKDRRKKRVSSLELILSYASFYGCMDIVATHEKLEKSFLG